MDLYFEMRIIKKAAKKMTAFLEIPTVNLLFLQHNPKPSKIS